VTELGLRLLASYRAMQKAVEAEAATFLPEFQKLLK
jgi:molybdenum-dependent DNA-binding transcriptional regulator ModE